MSERVAIVMAAGKGTRMNSELPKVLVPVCDRPMIDYVVQALRRAGVSRQIVVIGHRADLVESHLAGHPDMAFVRQREQLGTGHAVMMCRDALADFEGPVLVVAGDSPLMQSDSIEALFAEFERARPACILGTGYRDDPTGFGRILRDDTGQFAGIVEEKDASDPQRKITEVNLSCYVFNCRDLLASLRQLDNTNVQGEYYVTDCPGILLQRGLDVRALDVLKPCEALSINTVDDVQQVEAEMRRMQPAG
jgi:bifunctional UDP-N-acetylglucosamine pyrophosphorylase/glucosamine-1-phosphate N-acetyltransferase/UDP-N-acetylglucosamine pyrophosphorylase